MDPDTRAVISFVFVIPLLAACTTSSSKRQSQELSAEAAADAYPSGRVLSRDPTPQERAAIRDLHEAIEEIDSRYPRAPLPAWDAPLFRVTAVEPDGRIRLESGKHLRMDGVECSTEGIGYISTILTSDDTRITFPSTASASSDSVPAEIWVADVSPSNSGAQSRRYSLIAETTLVSGWCVPTPSPNGATYARYVALASLAPPRDPGRR